MSIYLDTSALAKLVLVEDETDALRALLRDRPDVPRITNGIGAVQLQRLAARVSQPALSTPVQLLTRIDRLALTTTALSRVAQLPPPAVRTLVALHIASAAELTDLEALVAYDARMITAAEGHGLPIASPAAP